MKTNNFVRSTLIHSTLALILAGLAGLPGRVIAQDKEGAKLIQLSARKPAVTPKSVDSSQAVAMSCPKCQDKWVAGGQPTFKGSQRETRMVPQHQCPTCQTKFVIEGVGKQAKEKPMHLCRNCGSQDTACCTTTKGGGATQGMRGPTGHAH